MEQEVSMAVTIGVTLIALSVAISIIWFTVYMGDDVANDVSLETNAIVTDVQVGTLNDIINKGGEKDIPASAAYSIVKTYSSYISNSEALEKKLRDNLSGRGDLIIRKNTDGSYSADFN